MTQALSDQPLREQMVTRVADRVKWDGYESKIGPWTLRVHVGTKWWDWTVNADVDFGLSAKSTKEKAVIQAGDASSEAKAKRAAAEWFARRLLDSCDAVGVLVKLAADPSKEPRRKPSRE